MIENHQKNLIPTKTVLKNKNWFEYLENKENPSESRYRCRICFKYFDEMKLPSNRKPAVAGENGVLNPCKKRNQQTISEHANSTSHANIISNLQTRSVKKQRESFFNDERSEENANDKYLEVTSRMIRTVFVINKLSLPFSDHSSLVTLQKLNGLNMGFHHYERFGCAKMTIVCMQFLSIIS